MIKLIAIDIDGTLLNEHHQLADEVKLALQKKAKEGVKIVLCTGRPILGVQNYLDELGFTGEDDYVITFNGALAQKVKSKEILAHHTLTIADYYKMERLALELGVHMHTETTEAMYTSNKDISKYTVIESGMTNMPLHYCTAEEMDRDMIISKMMFIDDPAILDAAIPHIPEKYLEEYEFVKSRDFFLEILNKKATKGNALKDLAEQLGIQREEVMAIGDNMNDMTMIEYAGVGVAMGNAVPELKAVADQVTKTNAENGVAYAVETWA